MIHHVSIPAREPRHVAEVLAELMNGKYFPFGPLEGAFMASNGDANGTMIEVYPERTTLDIPERDDQVVFGENPAPPQSWPFHVLLSVPHQAEEVERIGAREGWRAKTFGRGRQGHDPFFHRHRVLAGKPADDRDRNTGDGAGIPALPEGRQDHDDEGRRVHPLDASDPCERAGEKARLTRVP
jgi:hypothetical protein